VFPDPHKEPLAEHVALEDGTVREANESRKGRYLIETVDLNGASHRQRRKDRGAQVALVRNLERVITDDIATPEVVAELRKELSALRAQLEDEPRDPPDPCRCRLR
jgi:hypothetical protein